MFTRESIVTIAIQIIVMQLVCIPLQYAGIFRRLRMTSFVCMYDFTKSLGSKRFFMFLKKFLMLYLFDQKYWKNIILWNIIEISNNSFLF